jgi:hypothetical protein
MDDGEEKDIEEEEIDEEDQPVKITGLSNKTLQLILLAVLAFVIIAIMYMTLKIVKSYLSQPE